MSITTLPTALLTSIFDSTHSFVTARSLSLTCKRLHETWNTHLETLQIAHTFDDDPRWRGAKYRFFAVSIARAQAENAGEPLPSTPDAIKRGYALAGDINATVRLLVSELQPKLDTPTTTTWLEYTLAKSLYMLWLMSLTGGSACDPEYFVDSAAMVGFLLNPRFNCAHLSGVKDVVVASDEAPLEEIEEMCHVISERCEQNRKTMGMEYEAGEVVEDDLPDEFFDDSDMDDADDFGEDSEEEDEEDDAEWSDEESGDEKAPAHAHGHSHGGRGHSHGHSHGGKACGGH